MQQKGGIQCGEERNGKIVLFEMQYGMCSSKLYFSFNSNFFSIS
jgi:hypothetical protein